jgi:hypothetical protein
LAISDTLLYGNSYSTTDKCGNVTRIDPKDVCKAFDVPESLVGLADTSRTFSGRFDSWDKSLYSDFTPYTIGKTDGMSFKFTATSTG